MLLLLALLACTDADKGPGTDSGSTNTPTGTGTATGTGTGTGTGTPTDDDGDGVPTADDCDDADPSVGAAPTWYDDEDGDGYGDPATAQVICAPPAILVLDDTDCDDTNPDVHPGAAEPDCTDPTDYDCDGTVAWADDDADGTALCEDCDDTDADVHPGADEHCDGEDEDCDGDTDEDAIDEPTWYADADGDGYGDPSLGIASCASPGWITDATDCDDTRSGVHPGATETCVTSYDDDCDGDTNERDADSCVTRYEDLDGDGHGGPASACTCDPIADYGAAAADDCDDGDAGVSPDATEDCATAEDDDCDGATDAVQALGCTDWYLDADGDGSGDAASQCTCGPSGDYSATDAADCDDGDAAVSPLGTEDCDTLADDDCDGDTNAPDALHCDDYYADADADGYGTGTPTCACREPNEGDVQNGEDCDDTDAAVSPAATETCATPADDDCDGDTTGIDAPDCVDWYADADADTWPGADAVCACEATGVYTGADPGASADCDDGDDQVHPGATEACATSHDDDCDGVTNAQDAPHCTDYQVDADADGFGAADTACWCAPAGAYTADNADDCDDTDGAVNPDGTEVCNDGLDNDCDGGPGSCGPTDTPVTDADAFYWGEATDDYAGYDLAAGDVNGDGYDDVLIGAPYNNSGGTDLGSLYVMFGSANPASRTLSSADVELANTYSSGGLYLTSCIANAGDVNDDDIDDILIGGDGSHVLLVLGDGTLSTSYLTSADAAYEVDAINADLNEVAGLGDVNGDGFGDLLMGDYFHDRGDSNAGTAFLVYGSADPASLELSDADVLFWGESSNEYAGYTVAGPGDVDGDSVADLLIGADGNDSAGDSAGAAYFLSGVTATFDGSLAAADARYTGEAARDEAAYVSAVGDLDADGYADMVVGAPYNDDGATDAGALYIVPGSTNPGDASLSTAIQLRGEATDDHAGTDMAPGGDQDGDGFDDLLVGVAGYGSTGAAYLVRGGASLASISLAAADAFYVGEASNDSAGSSVASGDHDGDGQPDLFVGAQANDDGGTNAGTTYVILGEGL